MDSLFTENELIAGDLELYAPGTFWIFKTLAPEGAPNKHYNTRGMVMAHATYSNQWRIAHAERTIGTSWEQPIPELIEEPGLEIWTGRHAPIRTRSSPLPLSKIVTATRMTNDQEAQFKQEAQEWVALYIWSEEEYEDKLSSLLQIPELWRPTYKTGKVCNHQPWQWMRNVYGTYCAYCRKKIEDTKLPYPHCLWWSYHGSMGQGISPAEVQHPDDCRFCEGRQR